MPRLTLLALTACTLVACSPPTPSALNSETQLQVDFEGTLTSPKQSFEMGANCDPTPNEVVVRLVYTTPNNLTTTQRFTLQELQDTTLTVPAGKGVNAYILAIQTSSDRPNFTLNLWKDGQTGPVPNLLTHGLTLPLGELKTGGQHTLNINLTDLSASPLRFQWITPQNSTYRTQGVEFNILAPWVNTNAHRFQPGSPVIYAESTQYRWVKDATEHHGEAHIRNWGTAQPAVVITPPTEGLTSGQLLDVRTPPLYIQGELFGVEQKRFYLPESTCNAQPNDAPNALVRTVTW